MKSIYPRITRQDLKIARFRAHKRLGLGWKMPDEMYWRMYPYTGRMLRTAGRR